MNLVVVLFWDLFMRQKNRLLNLDRYFIMVCHPLSIVVMFQEKMSDEPQIESGESQSGVGASGAVELR